MRKSHLDPLADHLIGSYLETFSFSGRFRDEFGQPPTLITKVQFMYSVAQARLVRDGRYILEEEWLDFGRIAFIDRRDGRRYLLRSESTVMIELGKRNNTIAMFDPNNYLMVETGVTCVVHRFHKEGLDLSVAGTLQRDTGRGRLALSGPPAYVDTWPFGAAGPDDGFTFNQGGGDPFGDLGEMRDFGGGRQ